MRRINLLPPDERRGRRPGLPSASRGSIFGALLILGALLVMLMIGLYLFYFIRLGNEQDKIAAVDQDIAQQQARIQELSPYADLQARLDAKKPIADGIYRTRFPWDEFLQGLAFVIPDSTALDSFVGQATPVNIQTPPVEPPTVQALEPPGTITFTGVAEPEYQNVSDFMVRMNNLRFLANTQLTTAELDRETFASEAITFEVSAELVTRVGDDGNEVRLEDGQPDAGEDDTGAPLEDQQASRTGSNFSEVEYQYGQ